MTEEKSYTFVQAGLLIGKSRAYFGYLYKTHPEYFKDVILQKTGTVTLIKESDIPKVLAHTKKEGDRLRKTVLNAVYKAKSKGFAFTHQVLYQ